MSCITYNRDILLETELTFSKQKTSMKISSLEKIFKPTEILLKAKDFLLEYISYQMDIF